MVSTFTPNIGIEEPARGDDVGTWDTPVNTNMTLLDNVLANQVTIGLNNSNVVLSAGQAQSAFLTFNSTLTGSVSITFPTSYKKSYTIRHVCTGSSAFTITLQTTAAGGQVVGCRPGNPFTVYNDGTNIFFVNLGTEIGGYWDYAGSSVPNWISACTVPPYLNCNGGTFAAATYPTLNIILGSTTLPDMRGRARFTFDPSNATGRLTNILNGSVLFNAGGADTNTLVTGNLPAYTPSGSISNNGSVNNFVGANNFPTSFSAGTGGAEIWVAFPQGTATGIGAALFSGNAQGGASTPFGNVPPGIVSGITFIRSA